MKKAPCTGAFVCFGLLSDAEPRKNLILLAVLSFLGLINGFIYAFTGSLQLPVTWNVLILLLWAAVISGALFLVCCIADLVIQAFMLFDFFKVKKVIGRMTVRGIKPPASL
ncbi:MAG: hypothetical protein II124_01365 [Clostridia bacterium]|nr:hypothetical protein [Clostridia bacterium]